MVGKNCEICGNKMKGRSDKRFCSVKCKNEHHYNKRKAVADTVGTIDNILHQNHRIMLQLFEGEKRQYFKVPKLILSKMGFDFSYHTGIYINTKKKTYHYIYDYAWMEFSNQEIMVVRGRKARAI